MVEIDSFEAFVQKRLRMIKKNWKRLTAFYSVKGAPVTNNSIENYYPTSLKTHRKKQLRNERGIKNQMKLSAMKRAGVLGRCEKTLLEVFLMFVPFLDTGRRSSVVNDVRVSLAVAIDFWIDIQCLSECSQPEGDHARLRPDQAVRTRKLHARTGKGHIHQSGDRKGGDSGIKRPGYRKLNWQPDGRSDRRRKPVSPYSRAYLFLSRFIPLPRRPYLHQTPLVV